MIFKCWTDRKFTKVDPASFVLEWFGSQSIKYRNQPLSSVIDPRG